MSAPAGKSSRTSSTAVSSETLVDWAFFVFSALAAGWFAVMLLEESLQPRRLWFLVVFWVALAYLVLPRVHRVLTRIYLPNYFIGRTRTSDGLLGDPVNLAFRGQEAQLREALEEAGWTASDPVTLASSRRIVTDSILHRSYKAAPVSPLYLFGHQQDFAYQQELAGNPRQRHHLRFWRCPEGWLLPGGIAVDWLSAAAYDRSVGVSFFTLQITHRISANIDQERDYVVSSLTGSSADVELSVIKDFSAGYHSRNGGGDSFETDGDLPIVDVSRVPARPGEPSAASRPSAAGAKNRMQRPAPTLIGALLVFLRALAALVVSGAFLAKGGAEPWRSVLPAQDIVDLGSANAPVGVILVLFACVEAGLAVLILRGGNRARLAAMALSSAAILVQITAVLSGGSDTPIQANLVGYAFDVLVILALSSDRAREFAHRV